MSLPEEDRCEGCYCTEICIKCEKQPSVPCSDHCDGCMTAVVLFTDN